MNGETAKHYRAAASVLPLLSGIAFTFSSPEENFTSNENGVIAAAIRYPDFPGVRLQLKTGIDVDKHQPPLFYYTKYLCEYNEMCNVNQEKAFTYREIFENFLKGVLKDVQEYELLLLQNMTKRYDDNIEFYSSNGQRLIDINDILSAMMENEYARRVVIFQGKRFESDKMSFNEALRRLKDKKPRVEPLYDLAAQIKFPPIARVKKQFFSFS